MASPESGLVEVHLFGPGYGEGLLLHLGDGDWAIVDSCIDTRDEPAALKWLRENQLDPSTAVKLVVATHWHDDHVRGLAATFRACTGAQFVCSGAMLSEELLALAYDADSTALKASSGVGELRDIVDELQRRQCASGGKALGLGHRLAGVDSCIFQRTRGVPSRIWSLSPSSAELQAALNLFAAEIKQQGAEWQSRRRIIPRTPNHASVVLWVEVGDRKILLGADLEECNTDRASVFPDAGWSVIVASTTRPQFRASVFKVPHHGSKSAHCEDLWGRMLVPSPIAIMTPFARGRVGIPSADDCRRILDRTHRAYISAQVPTKRYKPKDSVVRWAMQGRNPRKRGEPGHLALRAPPDAGADWTIELLDGACTLEEYAAALEESA